MRPGTAGQPTGPCSPSVPVTGVAAEEIRIQMQLVRPGPTGAAREAAVTEQEPTAEAAAAAVCGAKRAESVP